MRIAVIVAGGRALVQERRPRAGCNEVVREALRFLKELHDRSPLLSRGRELRGTMRA